MAADQAEHELQQHAKRLLQDDGLKRILTVVKQKAFADWCNTGTNSVDTRESLHALFRGVTALEQRMKAYADGATLDDRKANAAAKKGT